MSAGRLQVGVKRQAAALVSAVIHLSQVAVLFLPILTALGDRSMEQAESFSRRVASLKEPVGVTVTAAQARRAAP